MEYSKKLTASARFDVVVCGSGCAGTAAAISSARAGAKTLVVERWGFSGGYVTAVYGPGLDGFVDVRSGRPVVGGIAAEFAQHAAGATENVMQQHFPPGSDLRNKKEYPDLHPLIINVEHFKLWADRLIRRAGGSILYHTHVADVVRYGDRITGVVLVNKAGITLVEASQFIDATGDADVAAFAGEPFDVEADLQPLSLHFRISGVKNLEAKLRDRCAAVLKQQVQLGNLPTYGGPWISQIGPDVINVNATRSPGDGTNPHDVTRAEIVGREDAWTMYESWKRELPEFDEAVFLSSGPVAGVRETRRIRGKSQITASDVAEGKRQPDVIVLGAWYLDRHPSNRSGYHVHKIVRPYDIGFLTMLPQHCENLVVAGRCHSADSAALASTRVTVTAMGMGEAAGLATALACQQKISVANTDISLLQRKLLDNGAVILDRAEEALADGDQLGENIPLSEER